MNEDDPEVIRERIRPRRRWPWLVGAAALIVALIVAAMIAGSADADEAGPRWETAPVTVGPIALGVAATGTVEPRRTVTVGSELSGLVDRVEVEANERVTEGQTLAVLDVSLLDEERAQTRAAREAAAARLASARATLAEAEARTTRLDALEPGEGIALAELDQARATLARAEAEVRLARAELARADATLRSVEERRDRSAIVSPIDGVVLRRVIEPGQTVASSFQAPELFVIAEDLDRMELRVAINEADVGLVHPGQSARFHVDAWPDEEFEARLKSVDLAPTLLGEVVTYTATLEAENRDAMLRPGMTASVVIDAGERLDRLRIPIEALWFRPPKNESGFSISIGPGGGGEEKERGSAVYLPAEEQTGEPRRVVLEIGRSDEEFAEVRSGELARGDLVIVGTEKEASEGETEAEKPRAVSARGAPGDEARP